MPDRVADRGDADAEAGEELDRSGADGSRRAVDEHVLPAPHLRAPERRERVVRTLGRGSGLCVGQVRGHARERPVFGDRQVLGVSPEGALDVAEDPVADREGGRAAPDLLDLARELGPEDGPLRRSQDARPVPQDELPGAAVSTVGPVDRRRVDLDEEFVVAGRRLLDFPDADHVRRTVPFEDRCPHGVPLSSDCSSCRARPARAAARGYNRTRRARQADAPVGCVLEAPLDRPRLPAVYRFSLEYEMMPSTAVAGRRPDMRAHEGDVPR